MDRDRSLMRDFYCYIHNGAGTFFSFVEGKLEADNEVDKLPLELNPSNLRDMVLSFGTNKNYFSGVRSLLVNWNMIGDGADIIRTMKYNGAGYAESMYLLIERWHPDDDTYYTYYEGRFDLAQTKDTIIGYDCPCIDSSVWGVLSQNDDVKYSIDCTSKAKNAVPILFDGITLKSKYTYQPVSAVFKVVTAPISPATIFDMVLVNTDGDSSGVITQSQHYQNTNTAVEGNFIYKTVKPNTIHLYGDFNYQFTKSKGGSVTFQLIARCSLSQLLILAQVTFVSTNQYTHHTIHFDVNIPLQSGEEVVLQILPTYAENGEDDFVFIPDVTNIYIDSLTKADASIVYGRYAVDVLGELVSRGTNGLYKVVSSYYSTNKNKVITCGNALRNAPNATIQTSFKDWFKAYDIEDWIAFRIVNNQMLVEPVPVIYDDKTNLFDVGEVKEVEIEDAYDYLCNEIELNMNRQDYRHTSGRLEFNSLNTFFIYQYNVKNKISLISPYRKDCYGMEFIRLDYQQQSTEDNSGDTNVFIVDVSSQTGTGVKGEFNYENIEINNQPLAPIIYYPLNNDIILNRKPVVRGACQPNKLVNIYVDGILDGSVTSGATPDGLFTYDIKRELSPFEQDINDGVHRIEATFTDLTGSPTARTVSIVDGVQQTAFENVHSGDNLYDNKPLLRGFLETGVTVNLLIDGALASAITGDGNGRWSYRTGVMSNGSHILAIGVVNIGITVNSFVALPLITSFQSGFELVNNLPLIEGVAIPGTVVKLYLDYYSPVSIGTATADASGNWSIQLVPMFKQDGFTVLTPIPNGNHIISTSLIIDSVPITIKGFLLNRPAYSSMTNVIDNSVFNTELTPMHNLKNRMRYWKSIFVQQPNTVIKFETGDKNIGFATILNGVTTKENDDVRLSDYSALPLFLPYILNCTVETPYYFADVIDQFNNGGLVKLTFKGFDIWCLPIGKMTVQDVTRNVQKWNLLISAKTPLSTLLKLSTSTVNIDIMGNSIYRSDYNTLHMVKYDVRVAVPEIHDDWFENRNDRWTNNPKYVQKIRILDGLVDQIIVEFSSTKVFQLRAYDSCGVYKASYTYTAVSPSPIQAPQVLMETVVDLNALGEGDYYFILFVDYLAAAISELVSLRTEHYGTILIDAGNSRNKTNAVFSNGWRSKVRVEGLIEKWIGSLETVINEDEIANFDNLRGVLSKKRTVLFGDGKGIPDWLYLKICNAIILDDLYIQGVGYTIAQDASVEPVEKIPGYPMYYYSVNFNLRENTNGFNFTQFSPYDRNITNAILADDTTYIDADNQKPLLSN
jgi:hypothetical protein